MSIEVSLAQFNKIASGKYNAGFIDFKSDGNGKIVGELRKVNNHVHTTGDNRETLSASRVLEIKEAFVAAMERAQVSQESISQIREELGIPKELDATGDKAQLRSLLSTRFKPLTRQQVREILDKYANGGKGFTDESRAAVSAKDARKAQKTANMSESRRQTRETVDRMNIESVTGGDYIDFSLTDVMSVLSTARSFSSLSTARQSRVKGEGDAAQELREAKVRDFGSGLATLFSVALKILPAGVRESDEFLFLGTPVKLVKGDDGALSAVVGGDVGKTTLKLGIDADTLVGRLATRSAQEREALGGGAVVKEMLNAAYAADIANGLMASDRTSLTRNFAARILEAHGKAELAPGEDAMVRLEREDYNTGLLVQIAHRSLNGELADANVIDTKQKLDNYYSKMRKDTANLPDDIKQLLEGVANMPLEPVDGGEFIVRAQLAGDIENQINAIHPVPAPQLPQNVTLANIKDFVADLVFSNDTMVSDVVINQPGETMRRMLSEPKKLAAFTAIVKDLDVLDSVTSGPVAAVIKAGFAEMKKKLDAAFKSANDGISIDQAKTQPDFDVRFAAFFRDAGKLPGEVIAEFDNHLDDMAANACVKIQSFINEVFDIHGGGVNAVKDPYSKMTKEDIKDELDKKTLNQILDESATSEVPGQVGFFKQVVSTYFTSLEQSDKRSCLAAALRYSGVFDFGGKQGDELHSAEAAALNKFTGAILKGAGPLLHKMMQGLPKDIMGKYADALDDMKQHLAPIPRKIVQAYLNKMIADSNGKIRSITLKKSLGAASVGEAFLCTVVTVERKPKVRMLSDYDEIEANHGDPWKTEVDDQGNVIYEDNEEKHEVVVKIMRHDAERRMEKEAQIFTAAAEKIPGMAKTWEGQLNQYRKEFDFRNEAQNVQEGVKLYGISNYERPEGEDGEGAAAAHPLKAIAPDVASMKLSPLAPPSKNIMVAEVVNGTTLDEYFKNSIAEIRSNVGAVFEQDSATGRIKWEEKAEPGTNQTVKKPVLRKNLLAGATGNALKFLHASNQKLTAASEKLMQATKVWFYNALIGEGKFHGDAHSGNLMISSGGIGFIDFGNLYQLERQRADGVNEQQELMRVILGAAFRDKGLFLKGFEKLMSAEGKALFKKPEKDGEENVVRAKAEAILDSILSVQHGSFSFNIVYRLQSAIVELQKLGLELPPQINCFIQSLVRLSNAITEINTIINQTRAMMDSLVKLDVPAPADRDELDCVGRAFDAFASEDGRKNVRVRKENNAYVLVGPNDAKSPADVMMRGYMQLIQSPYFGGTSKAPPTRFAENGTYATEVANRLRNAPDPIAAATKLANDFAGHFPPDSEERREVEESLATFSAIFRTALTMENPEGPKNVAIKLFSNSFARLQGKAVKDLRNSFESDIYLRKSAERQPPTFASAITDILFDNFNAVKRAVGEDGLRIYNDARGIVNSELHRKVGFFDADGVVDAIQDDAKREGGDNSYKIDIGV